MAIRTSTAMFALLPLLFSTVIASPKPTPMPIAAAMNKRQGSPTTPSSSLITTAPGLTCTDGSTVTFTNECTFGYPISYCTKPEPITSCPPGSFPGTWHPGHCETGTKTLPKQSRPCSCSLVTNLPLPSPNLLRHRRLLPHPLLLQRRHRLQHRNPLLGHSRRRHHHRRHHERPLLLRRQQLLHLVPDRARHRRRQPRGLLPPPRRQWDGLPRRDDGKRVHE